jgi:hypothetical protein
MDNDIRILRERQAALRSRMDRAQGAPPLATARRLVQVFDGGSMPSQPDHFYLAHPVEVNGGETEGGSYSAVVDASTTLAVDVLGHAPSAGDLLTAYAVGGRWVAERGQPVQPGFLCGSCLIPQRDLTVSWTNSISGPGSTTMVYSPHPDSWASGCANELLFNLLCNGGQLEFRVTYFISGVCPTGQQQHCSTLGGNPFRLVQTGLTCGDSFLLTANCTFTGCTSLALSGYQTFTVST